VERALHAASTTAPEPARPIQCARRISSAPSLRVGFRPARAMLALRRSSAGERIALTLPSRLGGRSALAGNSIGWLMARRLLDPAASRVSNPRRREVGCRGDQRGRFRSFRSVFDPLSNGPMARHAASRNSAPRAGPRPNAVFALGGIELSESRNSLGRLRSGAQPPARGSHWVMGR